MTDDNQAFIADIEDQIIRREAVDLVLSSLRGYEFIIVYLWMDGWKLREIAAHLEWDRQRVYAYWDRIKQKGRKVLSANGFTYEGNSDRDRLKSNREGEGHNLPSAQADRPTPFSGNGRDHGKRNKSSH